MFSPLSSSEGVYPHHSELKTRLVTFNTWPIQLKQKPMEVAAAGLFHSSLGTEVI